MSYFAEFIFANCCINSQIKKLTFLMKGFCFFSSSNVCFHYKKTWKNDYNIFSYKKYNVVWKSLNIFQYLFLQSWKVEKKNANFVEFNFTIQCFLRNFPEFNLAILGQIRKNKFSANLWSQKLTPLR